MGTTRNEKIEQHLRVRSRMSEIEDSLLQTEMRKHVAGKLPEVRLQRDRGHRTKNMQNDLEKGNSAITASRNLRTAQSGKRRGDIATSINENHITAIRTAVRGTKGIR